MSDKARGFARLWKFCTSWKFFAAMALGLLLLFLAWVIPRPNDPPAHGWDTSHWQAFQAIWRQAAGLTAILVAVVMVMFLGSSRIAEKAPTAKFFLISFILHVLAVVLMLYIPLAERVIERAEEIRVEASRALDEELRSDPDRTQQAYEKVADLQSPEKIEPSEISRQTASRPRAPVPADAPSPTLPPELARALPLNRLLFVPPAAEPRQQAPTVAELARRPLAPPRIAEVEIDFEKAPAPVETPAERPLQASAVVERREPVAAPPASALNFVPPRISAVPAAPATIPTPDEAAAPPAAIPQTTALPRVAAIQAPAATMPAEVVMPVVSAAPEGEAPLQAQDVLGARREPSEQPSPRQVPTSIPRLAKLQPQPVDATEPAIDITSEKSERPIGRAIETPIAAAEAPLAADLPSVERPTPAPAEIEAPESNLTRQTNDAPAADAVAAIAQTAPTLPAPSVKPTINRPVEPGPQPSPSLATAPQVARAIVAPAEMAADAGELEMPVPMPAAEDSLESPQADGAATELARSDPLLLEVDDRTTSEIARESQAMQQALLAGGEEQSPADLPAPNALPNRLARLPFDAAPVAHADDSVALRAMFTLRQGDVRREFIELFGGTPESEEAVRRGLTWIGQHQEEDGHWSLNQFNARCKDHPQCNGHGSAHSDTAATGFALLPFLGAGHTHQTGDHQAVISKALKWLVAQQKPDGDLHVGPPGNVRMYGHGIAAIALCEAYGLTQDPELRPAAQRSLDFIVAAQHPSAGGWRYNPGEPGDTSVVGWQVMALKSGEMAGLPVPARSLELAAVWLKSVEASGDQIGRFGYQGPGASAAMTAEALLCRQFLGARRDDPSMKAGAKFLLTQLPRQGQETSYYWYYSTQVMYHMQAEYWEAWNASLRDLLVGTQLKDGPMAGTWNPTDPWEVQGGRLYSTAMRLLMLEIYYRHLPLYRQLE